MLTDRSGDEHLEMTLTLSRYNLEGQNQIKKSKRLRDYNAVFQLI